MDGSGGQWTVQENREERKRTEGEQRGAKEDSEEAKEDSEEIRMTKQLATVCGCELFHFMNTVC